MKYYFGTREEFVAMTAKSLYLRLPWWKRWQFRRWYRSNNWDVRHIYEECLLEAEAIAKENDSKFKSNI